MDESELLLGRRVREGIVRRLDDSLLVQAVPVHQVLVLLHERRDRALQDLHEPSLAVAALHRRDPEPGVTGVGARVEELHGRSDRGPDSVIEHRPERSRQELGELRRVEAHLQDQVRSAVADQHAYAKGSQLLLERTQFRNPCLVDRTHLGDVVCRGQQHQRRPHGLHIREVGHAQYVLQRGRQDLDQLRVQQLDRTQVQLAGRELLGQGPDLDDALRVQLQEGDEVVRILEGVVDAVDQQDQVVAAAQGHHLRDLLGRPSLLEDRGVDDVGHVQRAERRVQVRILDVQRDELGSRLRDVVHHVGPDALLGEDADPGGCGSRTPQREHVEQALDAVRGAVRDEHVLRLQHRGRPALRAVEVGDGLAVPRSAAEGGVVPLLAVEPEVQHRMQVVIGVADVPRAYLDALRDRLVHVCEQGAHRTADQALLDARGHEVGELLVEVDLLGLCPQVDSAGGEPLLLLAGLQDGSSDAVRVRGERELVQARGQVQILDESELTEGLGENEQEGTLAFDFAFYFRGRSTTSFVEEHTQAVIAGAPSD